MTPAVVVENLSKRYTLGTGGGYRRLTEVLSSRVKRSPSHIRDDRVLWALRDVSFDVAEGEVVGIVGRNGAGKSTLLKVLSRITEPTSGRARLRGRVGSLLEVGTGFHPELTGRDNIFLNGAVLGMRKSEIARRFDEIVDFAEVGRFLDTPVKRYSSGMYVRLAFAVAAHLEPEILVVDEVLAVGDGAFQKKCLGKMGDVARSGRTVLFVSHNMAAVESLCNRAVLLEGGALSAEGAVSDVVRGYLATLRTVADVDLSKRGDRTGDGRVRATGLSLDVDGDAADALVCGRPGQIRISLDATATAKTAIRISLGFSTAQGEGALMLDSQLVGDELSAGDEVVCALNRVPLVPGSYRVNVYIEAAGVISDWIQDAAVIEVIDGDFFGTGRLPPSGYGNVVVAHRWTVT